MGGYITMINRHNILKSPKYYPFAPDWNKKVYMPVSMNNRLIKDNSTLLEILEWIFDKTDHFDAIIGDFLHRHNIMMGGVSEEDSIKISEKIGQDIIDLLQIAMKEFPGKTLNIRLVKEFYSKTEIFDNKLKYFFDLYKSNTTFCEEIHSLITQFLNRQGDIKKSVEQVEFCKRYILEELVIFEMLAEERFYINVYPGKQLTVFKKIVTNQLRGISNELERVSLIELRVKPAFAKKLA